MKIRHVGAEFFRTDGYADKTKYETDSRFFRNFANARKNWHCTCRI